LLELWELLLRLSRLTESGSGGEEDATVTG